MSRARLNVGANYQGGVEADRKGGGGAQRGHVGRRAKYGVSSKFPLVAPIFPATAHPSSLRASTYSGRAPFLLYFIFFLFGCWPHIGESHRESLAMIYTLPFVEGFVLTGEKHLYIYAPRGFACVFDLPPPIAKI